MTITLDAAEKRIEALQEQIARLEHDLKHQRFLSSPEKFKIKAQLYENNKEIEYLRKEIEGGRI